MCEDLSYQSYVVVLVMIIKSRIKVKVGGNWSFIEALEGLNNYIDRLEIFEKMTLFKALLQLVFQKMCLLIGFMTCKTHNLSQMIYGYVESSDHATFDHLSDNQKMTDIYF